MTPTKQWPAWSPTASVVIDHWQTPTGLVPTNAHVVQFRRDDKPRAAVIIAVFGASHPDISDLHCVWAGYRWLLTTPLDQLAGDDPLRSIEAQTWAYVKPPQAVISVGTAGEADAAAGQLAAFLKDQDGQSLLELRAAPVIEAFGWTGVPAPARGGHRIGHHDSPRAPGTPR